LNLTSQGHNIISFQQNEDYQGNEHIGTLFNAILYKRALKITYQDFKSEFPYDIIFHPYHLKQYNARWFLFGHNPSFKLSIQNLALDRIIAFEELADEYKYLEVNWDEYFSDIIGVTKKDEPPVEIKILILDKEQALYIKTKPLHHSQKPVRKTALGYETSIKVIPNVELFRLILSYGPKIKILSPEDLISKIQQTIQEYGKVYSSD